VVNDRFWNLFDKLNLFSQLACHVSFALTALFSVNNFRLVLKYKVNSLWHREISHFISTIFFLGGLYIFAWRRSDQFLKLVNQFQLYSQEAPKCVVKTTIKVRILLFFASVKHTPNETFLRTFQIKCLTLSIVIGVSVWSTAVGLFNELCSNNWDHNYIATDWANKSIPYLGVESYSAEILSNVPLRICFAGFYMVVTCAFMLVITIPETGLLLAGLCWLETVNKFKKEIESDQNLISGNKVHIY